MSRRPASPIGSVLDEVAAEGRVLDLWWRDDDAVSHTPALDRLLRLRAATGCPVSLAVIPARFERSLVDRLAGERSATVLTHGVSHANHAQPGEKRSELGSHRPWPAIAGELRGAAARVVGAFGPQAAPVLVPPWNRISPEHVARLSEIGFRSLSAFGTPVRSGSADRGLRRIDTHLDPVSWRGDRGLVAPETLASAARIAVEGGTSALGLLTHHLVFDEALWRFLESFLEEMSGHPAIRFCRIEDLLDPEAPSSPCLDRHGSGARMQAGLERAALEPAW